jgi:hypothetical protein
MHLVQVPIVLGRGVRVWNGMEALEADYDIEAVSALSGVTRLTFDRKTPCARPQTLLSLEAAAVPPSPPTR